MKIVVCVKTATGAAVSPEDAFERAERTAPGALGPSDAHAVEEALRITEARGEGEIVVVAIAPSETLGAVRMALAMGAQRAVMLSDPKLAGADVVAVSRALAALLKRESADLHLRCSWSGDVDGSLLWTAAGERLGLPVMTQARSLVLRDARATIERQNETGDLTISAALPCMIDMTDSINTPRHPSLKSAALARGKPIEMIDLSALGLSPDAAASGARVVGLGAPPPRATPIVLADPLTAPARILALLEERRLLR